MSQSRAIARYNRISMKKMLRLTKALNRKKYLQAMAYLDNLPHKGARIVEKTMKSAYSNLMEIMRESKGFKPENVFIQSIIVNEGPTLKRIKRRARGRADRIDKRTSHLIVNLSLQ